MTTQEVLQQCTVDGNIVKLPEGQLDRKLYEDVAKRLQGIGGKWKGGKTAGFVFVTDPTELLDQIAGGEKINIKKEYQFFATPDDVADNLVSIANIYDYDVILEPSAGQGAIIKAIRRFGIQTPVFYVEKMEQNARVLDNHINNTGEKTYRIHLKDQDFLNMAVCPAFNVIVANPPFSNNQDVDHIRHMYDMLKPDGRLVSIVFDNWDTADKKKKMFIQWLKDVNAEIIDLPSGTFKESGTSVKTKIVIINKKNL